MAEKISELKDKRREGDAWSAENEQILAFLVELHILRISKTHAEVEAKRITEVIYRLHDEMQDEKGLLER